MVNPPLRITDKKVHPRDSFVLRKPPQKRNIRPDLRNIPRPPLL